MILIKKKRMPENGSEATDLPEHNHACNAT
jgi:hypothetical protein